MLFTVAFLAASAVASPVTKLTKLPLSHHIHVTNFKNIVDRGRARIDAVNGGRNLEVRASSGPATNEDVSYIAVTKIGSKSYNLIVDTGSSNTWCGAQSSCEPSAGGKSTGGRVSVSYGSGSFSGNEYTDSVTYAGLTVASQSIGSATSSQGFSGVDGIFGFGPVGLTQGTVSNANTVPTFMDNLYKQGSISPEALGVYFKPESGSDTADVNGELTLGGTDSSKYSGSISYYPKVTSGNAAPYWGLAIGGFTYAGNSIGGSTQGIIDTGTTLIYIPTAAYNAFLKATGGTTDSSSGLAAFTTKPTGTFGTIFGSTTYTLTPDQYLVPSAQYSNFGLATGKYYAWINNGGSSGVNVIVGQKFLEQYYSVFDTTNSRIGFAPRT